MSLARDVWPSERARLMSGHMMPIEREAAVATVEIMQLEEWLEADLKCESEHRATGKHNCQRVATHLSRTVHMGTRKLVCSTAADYITHWRGVEDAVCECGSPIVDCWLLAAI